MFKSDKECPICSAEGTVEIVTNVTKEYRNSDNKLFEVEGLVSLRCSACGESYINSQADKHNAPKILDAKRLSEGLLPSSEICRILDKVKETSHLPESQIERILGIADRSLPRWKTRVAQSAMADAIFLLLDRDPGAITYIAERRGINVAMGRARGRRRLQP